MSERAESVSVRETEPSEKLSGVALKIAMIRGTEGADKRSGEEGEGKGMIGASAGGWVWGSRRRSVSRGTRRMGWM
jgi:hypothetical protein